MFHTCVHISSSLLHQTLSPVLSQRSCLVHTCHLIVPFSSPILFSSIFVLHINQVHQRIFGSAGFGVIYSSCCVGGPGPAWCLGHGEGTSVVHQAVGVASDALHPNPPPHFYKWGNLVSICISPVLLQLNLALPGLGLGVLFYCRWVGLYSDVGRGISGMMDTGQSLPYLKKIARHFFSSRPWSPCMNRGIF